ncbi:MAG TPA: hypothetical protein VFO54_07280 [Chryseosolibacter sp.]|nr:hypothetical protein [Chryseosolibacter sp.]
MLKQKTANYLLLILSAALYIAMGYGIQRHQTLPLFACYYSLFILFFLMVRHHETITEHELKFWVFTGIFFRALLLFSVPALSDDFYRFIWDGRLLAAGYHPFAEVPSFYMTHQMAIPGIDQELFDKLNAKGTFTVYPPFSQFIFWLSVILSPRSVYGSMLVMKVILFLFEIGTLWIVAKTLRQLTLPSSNILLYSLNPLVILELTGNLHFEGVMIFFLLLAVLLLNREQTRWSALAYSLSVCSKLIPLLLMPLFVRQLGWKKTMVYWFVTIAFTFFLFLPLLNMEIIHGLSTGLGYYFQRFEFNASIYYLVREAGHLIFGFNVIQVAGPLLALTAMVLILTLAFRKLPSIFPNRLDAGFFRLAVWSLFVYFLSTAILHPWYIITLLALSLFTPYRFPLVWTAVIFLSYAGYSPGRFEENLLLVGLEYLVVIAYLLYETVWTKKLSHF